MDTAIRNRKNEGTVFQGSHAGDQKNITNIDNSGEAYKTVLGYLLDRNKHLYEELINETRTKLKLEVENMYLNEEITRLKSALNQ